MNVQSATHTFAVDKWKDYVALHNRIEEKFSCCMNYDFSKQIDLTLLFLYIMPSVILFPRRS